MYDCKRSEDGIAWSVGAWMGLELGWGWGGRGVEVEVLGRG